MESSLGFKWKKRFSNYSIQVEEDTLILHIKSFFSETKLTFSILDLDFREQIYTRWDFKSLTYSLLALTLGSFWLYLSITDKEKGNFFGQIILGIISFGIIFGSFYLFNKFLGNSGTYYVVFYKNSSKAAFQVPKINFIETHFSDLMLLVKEHHLLSGQNLTVAQQLHQIAALYDKGFLSLEEYTAAKDKVLQMFNQ